MWMALMAAAGVGANLLQARNQAQAANQNIRREKQAAEWRADDRRAALRESIAAQRVMAVSQGSSADMGSNLNLKNVSLDNFMTDIERDAFQTDGNIQSLKAAKMTAILNGIAGSSQSLLTYSKYNRQTLGGAAKPTYIPQNPELDKMLPGRGGR